MRKGVTAKINFFFKDKYVENGYSSFYLESFTALIIKHFQRIYIVEKVESQKSNITAYVVPI